MENRLDSAVVEILDRTQQGTITWSVRVGHSGDYQARCAGRMLFLSEDGLVVSGPENRGPTFRFPDSKPVRDLFRVVSYMCADVGGFLDELMAQSVSR